MVDFSKVRAIDFRTHAEEPYCDHRDDGYNEFKAGMAKYFKNPVEASGMLPTVQEAAAYYRDLNIAAVIFLVDAERETGFRRHPNEGGLAVAQHKPNVYYDMSVWSPKYFLETFIRYVRKMLFGSDWPAITLDRWLANFENASFKDEVHPLILKENTTRLLGEADG